MSDICSPSAHQIRNSIPIGAVLWSRHMPPLHLVREPSHAQAPPATHCYRFLQPFIPLELFEYVLFVWHWQGSVPDNSRPVAAQQRAAQYMLSLALPREVPPSPSTSPSDLLPAHLRDASSAASRARDTTSPRSPSDVPFLSLTGQPPQVTNLGRALATNSNSACSVRSRASLRARSPAHSWFGKPSGFFPDPAASSPPTFCLFRTMPEHLGLWPWLSCDPWQRRWVPLASFRVAA